MRNQRQCCWRMLPSGAECWPRLPARTGRRGQQVPLIPHGIAGAAVPSHLGTGREPPAPTTPTAAWHSRSSAPAGAAANSRDPQSLAAQNIPRHDPGGQPGHASAVHKAARRSFSPNFSITQCDAACELAGIRPYATATCTQVAEGPSLHRTAHASAACAVPFRCVCDVPDQVQRESSHLATTPVGPE